MLGRDPPKRSVVAKQVATPKARVVAKESTEARIIIIWLNT